MAYYLGNDDFSSVNMRGSGTISSVLSPDGTLLYAAVSGGRIAVYDIATGALVSSWNTGGEPGGVSISPDGSTLLVTIPGGGNTPGLIQQFDTATGARTSIRSDSAFHDVSFSGNGEAILTGDGIFKLDLASGSLTDVSVDQFYSSGGSVMVSDGSLTLLAEMNSSDGALAIYDARTGTITAVGDNYQDGLSSGFNFGVQAISEAAGLVLQFNYYGSVNIYDLQLNAVRNVYLDQPIAGLAFSRDGASVYVVHETTGEMVRYNSSTWEAEERFDLPQSNFGYTSQFGDQLTVTADGQVIVTNTASGQTQLFDFSGRDEFFRGTRGADTFEGLKGDDIYVVNDAGDRVIEQAGAGVDLIRLVGIANYRLGANIENLRVVSTADTDITGNDLNNAIIGSKVGDKIDGLAGDDFIRGLSGDDLLIGGDGDDILHGNAGNDVLNGGDGNDYLDGGAGYDTMRGGMGDDTYFVDKMTDRVREAAGEGTDTVLTKLSGYHLAANVENLTGSRASAQTLYGNELANVINGGRYGDRLYGEDGDDTILGNKGADSLFGGAGDDRLEGGLGNDRLDGGAGADIMLGGAGNDYYIVDGSSDYIIESADEGIDTIEKSTSEAYQDFYIPDNVENIIDTSPLGNAIYGNDLDNVISFVGAPPAGYTGVTTARGGNGNDTLNGGAADDDLYGDDGNDVLRGGAGNDTLTSGSGNDRMYGGAGNDTLHIDYGGTNLADGGSGNDLFWAESGDNTLIGGRGDDVYDLWGGTNVIVEDAGGGIDKVRTFDTHYTLGANIEDLEAIGWSGSRWLTGNALDNTIMGSDSGNNTLYGLAGDDTLRGAGGADILVGGTGADTLTGGTGNDVFVFDDGDLGSAAGATDIITDFNRFQGDIIDLSAIDARTTNGGNQAFTFIGTGAFTGAAGQMRYETTATGSVIQMDTNGDAQADYSLVVDGAFSFSASDFVF